MSSSSSSSASSSTAAAAPSKLSSLFTPSLPIGPFLVSRPSRLFNALIPHLDRIDDWVDQRQQSIAAIRSTAYMTLFVACLAIAMVSSIWYVITSLVILLLVWTIVAYVRRHTQRLSGFDPAGAVIRDVHIRVFDVLMLRLPGFTLPPIWLRHARHPETMSAWPSEGATIRLHGTPGEWAQQAFRLGHEMIHCIVGHSTLSMQQPIIDGNNNHIPATALAVPRTLFGRYHRWSIIEELMAEAGSQFVMLQCAAQAKGYGHNSRLNSQTLSAYLAGVHSHAARMVNDGRSLNSEDIPRRFNEWLPQLEMTGKAELEPMQREQLAAIASVILTELLIRPFGLTAIPFLRNVDREARDAPSLSSYMDSWYNACPVSSLSSPIAPMEYAATPPSSPSNNIIYNDMLSSSCIPSREAIAGARPFVTYLRTLLIGSTADQQYTANASNIESSIVAAAAAKLMQQHIAQQIANNNGDNGDNGDDHEYDIVEHHDAATSSSASAVDHNDTGPQPTATAPSVSSAQPSTSSAPLPLTSIEDVVGAAVSAAADETAAIVSPSAPSSLPPTPSIAAVAEPLTSSSSSSPITPINATGNDSQSS